ncbi:hypothetical protein C8J57DRAFT_1265831 [Mycena rebaudengoi]|nr:hypothetical protein C8J57DRAFT_1265831 [Mycena rebaudengoi]
MRLPVEVWWRAVIVGSPIFWRCLEIGSASHPGWVSIALARCNNRSIYLCLHITSSRNFTAAARSKAVITSLRPYRSQLEFFRVTLADPSSLKAFRELVAGSRFPRLGVLSLRVVVDGTGSTRLIPIFRYLEDTVFSDLVTSRSHYMGLAWSRNVITCNLHTLVFRGLGPHFRLSWSDYRHIFKYTPCLQRLCLRNVSCHSAPPELEVFAALEELHELDIAFTSDMTLSDLLKSICAPHLRVLRFAGHHLGLDIVSLADCVDLLATVTHLDWTVGDTGIGPYSRLFMSLPQSRELEVRTRENYVLGSLIAAGRLLTSGRALRVDMCPMLTVIGVNRLSPPHLVRFLRERGVDSSPVERVNFRQPFSGVDYSTSLEWMAAKEMRVVVGVRSEHHGWICVSDDLSRKSEGPQDSYRHAKHWPQAKSIRLRSTEIVYEYYTGRSRYFAAVFWDLSS